MSTSIFRITKKNLQNCNASLMNTRIRKAPGCLFCIRRRVVRVPSGGSAGIYRGSLDIPLTDIYGVATFYSQFTLQPKGKYTIGVCMGTACYVKGAQAVLDELSKEIGIKPGETSEDFVFTLEATRCLGACGLAPVIMINDDVYGRLVPSTSRASLTNIEAGNKWRIFHLL